MRNLKEELNNLRFTNGLDSGVACSESENIIYSSMMKNGEKLPDNVFQYGSGYLFYKSGTNVFSESEEAEYITLKKLSYLKTIKNCVVFFTVLTIVSLIIILAVQFNLLSSLKHLIHF